MVETGGRFAYTRVSSMSHGRSVGRLCGSSKLAHHSKFFRGVRSDCASDVRSLSAVELQFCLHGLCV